jgi:fucose 4-O-acetylase-like acetyltransferase
MPKGSHHRPRAQREIYIDAFRGLMALVMVQGHVMDSLLTRELLQQPLYVFQQMFHGSTAPGFLFASGFVAGLPRAPLSLRASLRRARRLLFVLLVGYFLHLPYLSFWKTIGGASEAEQQLMLSCDALHVIAVTQLFVLLLQWLARRHWTRVAAGLSAAIIAATPIVWDSGLWRQLHPALGAYLDPASRFPIFPFSAFVLAGTLAGATLGRVEPALRHRRALVAGAALLGLGAIAGWLLAGKVDYWGPSPAYSLVRLGGLVLLMRLVEIAAQAALPGIRALGLLGHETLLVYVLHLFLLFGGVLGTSPLALLQGELGFLQATLVVLAMLPVLLAAAWAWRTAKHRAPKEAQMALVFVTLAFLYEYLVRPW